MNQYTAQKLSKPAVNNHSRWDKIDDIRALLKPATPRRAHELGRTFYALRARQSFLNLKWK